MIELLELDKTDWEIYVKTHQNVVESLGIDDTKLCGERAVKTLKGQ